MKINVEFDLTPEEFRRALGLPDVEAFQQELLGRIQKQMESGVEGYDPMSLMQPFLQQPMLQQGLSQGLASFGNYQQMMLDMLSRAASGAKSGDGGNPGSSEGAGGSEKSGTERASSASARSRRQREG
ncbi:DUF6489 family protein [Halomonas beimenensis]|uniref:Uncharacterized protein n=1 Tax=Halomonas beimenensis TaxID=475662 RepID=A0A291P4N7_9GAMM|nr:DUF6489 family protein [Halomonas beimenensis]ATJ81847.1 hypothetical protein BEI_0860 [Halomonas beimenensis]